MIDEYYLIPMIQAILAWTTDCFYSFFIDPFEKHVTIEGFLCVFAAIAAPSQLLIHAGRYTLSSFYGGRRNKLRHRRPRRTRKEGIRRYMRTKNLRLRRAISYIRSGGRGIFHATKSSLYYRCDPYCTWPRRPRKDDPCPCPQCSNNNTSPPPCSDNDNTCPPCSDNNENNNNKNKNKNNNNTPLSATNNKNTNNNNTPPSSAAKLNAATNNNTTPPAATFTSATNNNYPFAETNSAPFQPSSATIATFLSSFDVLTHHRVIQHHSTTTIPSHYKSLDPSDIRYRRILLEAKGLQTTLSNYGEDMPLLHPTIYVSTISKELPIVIDTGASCSITPTAQDFIDAPTTADTKTMGGLTGTTTEVLGQGMVNWDIEDVHGVRSPLITSAYFVPNATIRLFSPQVYIKEQYEKDQTICTLTLDPFGIALKMACGKVLKFPIQKGCNLPMMLTNKALHQGDISNATELKKHSRGGDRFANFVSFVTSATFVYFNHKATFHLPTSIAIPSKIEEDGPTLAKKNWNLDDPQRELCLWHQRLGHINFKHVKSLLAKPDSDNRSEHKHRLIKPSNNKSSHCKTPLCEACQYAKQKRRSPDSTKSVARPENEGTLSVDVLKAGQRVSVDLYVSAIRGRLLNSFGKEKPENQYTGGAIFVDHATRLIHHSHQLSTTAAETVSSKHLFEQYCNDHGVKVKEYVGDNNPFHSNDWKVDCENQRQKRTFSGVGAHHQNYAERNIQTIFNMARALLLHFAVHWPQMADAQLWPFAVDHAIYLWNNLPAHDDTKLCPLELFTDTLHHNHHHLQRLHVFGCPVYVLDPKLQDGKKLPKWERRSRRGIYLGVSKYHSTTVHLVLNPSTGKISPQYHVVFDDTFSTVFSDGKFTEDVWNSLVLSNHDRHPNTDSAIDIVPFQEIESRIEGEQPQPPINETNPTPGLPEGTSTDRIEDHFQPSLSTEGVISSAEGDISAAEGDISSPEGGIVSATEGVITAAEGAQPPVLRRSTRIRKNIERLNLFTINNNKQRSLIEDMLSQTTSCPSGSQQTHFNSQDKPSKLSSDRVNQQALANFNWDHLVNAVSTTSSAFGAFLAEHQQNLTYDNLVEYLNPALLITLANKEDNPTYKEAMVSPEAAGFVKAMETEILTLIELEVFEIVSRPKGKVISGVWALKRKRYPDGSVRKLKARYCARGFEQEHGVDYFETFAPVVMWLTVRLLLVMSILMDLDTKQIDYTAAFVHAPIDCLVYVEMPPRFSLPGKVWKLKKSLYGLKNSPRNFFLHTKGKLEKLGFVQSNADPCLFISKDVICLIYVDDALFFYKDAAAIDRLTQAMKKDNILFREEDSVAGYLGVHIDRKDDGSIHLTQKGLAERIVEALNLNNFDSTAVETPCTGYLPLDEHGEDAHEDFSYRSIVGQLNYLQGHSRCDIGMATSQVARYVHRPKRSHELALIQIGRYLKGTLDKGLILKPTNNDSFKMDVYVDAAFACGWGTEVGTNPDSVKSRTGYIIEIANCPVIWVSKLQSTIATSTMESEYTALSMALRAAIPLLAVVSSVTEGLHYHKHKQLTFKATVHEDNQGALILAKLEPGRHTVRSKFYALRLHWFRSWIIPNDIEVQFIASLDQKADFLTKALAPRVFKANRKLSMGW